METAIACLQAEAAKQGVEIREFRKYGGKDAYHLRFGLGENEEDISVTGRTLIQLAADERLRAACSNYLFSVRKRCENPAPNHFLTCSRKPVAVEFDWPIEPLPRRAATYIHCTLRDLQRPDTIARLSLVRTYPQERSDDPFSITMQFTNRLRSLVDAGKARLYPEDKHPVEIASFDLADDDGHASVHCDHREFLKAKVYWLGFRQGSRHSRVWIADPWDAAYLKTDTRTLLQAAQVLEAQGFIELTQDTAAASRELLRHTDAFERNEPNTIAAVNDTYAFDLFICHASEDKDVFVRPLAQALADRGLRVWYDEWTLTLGDSLRAKIDDGLASSRFGIVVLSKPFFTKNWPKRELDGMVSMERADRNIVLPIWHEVTADEVERRSPLLASRLAASSAEGIPRIVAKILDAVGERSVTTTGTVPHYADPPEYWAQRRTLPDTEIATKIWGLPRWHIWIRPTEFQKARFRDLDHCRRFIAHAAAHGQSRLSPYPHAEDVRYGDEWIGAEHEVADQDVAHADRWTLFRSGQFINRRALTAGPLHSRRVHVLEILDMATAATTLAQRMSREHILLPMAALTFELAGHRRPPAHMAPRRDRRQRPR